MLPYLSTFEFQTQAFLVFHYILLAFIYCSMKQAHLVSIYVGSHGP